MTKTTARGLALQRVRPLASHCRRPEPPPGFDELAVQVRSELGAGAERREHRGRPPVFDHFGTEEIRRHDTVAIE